MFNRTIPDNIEAIDPRLWESFAPYYAELAERPLTTGTAYDWLADWSHLTRLIQEAVAITYIEKSVDTTDEEKEQAFLDLINNVIPRAREAEQTLKQRLLALDMPPQPDLATMLRQMRNEADLFRQENIPLLTELARLSNEYDKLTGQLEAEWDGEKKNLSQLTRYLQEKDRHVRERAWRAMMDLWLSVRQPLNEMYTNMLDLRQQVAENAGLPDYRAYAFREYGRFDYTPEDCFTFHEAIEQVVVPAARRVYEKKQRRLGLDTLRPWDTQVDPSDEPPLLPYTGQTELVQGSLNIFQQVDAELARYFAIMAEEELLDLDTRAGKALGGFCSSLPLRKRPFIFMNGVGIHDDVQTMLHEAGHAFHAFASFTQPLIWQENAPMEFCEVASMAMELLAAPYLTQQHGGFYTLAEAARARIEHLEGILTFLPYMAVVDAFQHWVYTHPQEARSPAACDAAWRSLWQRFMPGIDWEGLETEQETGWHRKLHIFTVPFYYIEYGMAQIGALQVWRNSLTDPAGALAAYRRALALGGTRPLPELFAAAGAEFRFDAGLLTELAGLIEKTLDELEAVLS